MLGCYIPCPDILNITILLYGITRRQELGLILLTVCCGGLNLSRVSDYDGFYLNR